MSRMKWEVNLQISGLVETILGMQVKMMGVEWTIKEIEIISILAWEQVEEEVTEVDVVEAIEEVVVVEEVVISIDSSKKATIWEEMTKMILMMEITSPKGIAMASARAKTTTGSTTIISRMTGAEQEQVLVLIDGENLSSLVMVRQRSQ